MTKFNGLHMVHCTKAAARLEPGHVGWGEKMLGLELKCPSILKGCPGSLGYWLDKMTFLWLYSTNLETKTKTSHSKVLK